MLKILAIGAQPGLNSIKSDLIKKDIELTTSYFTNTRIEIVNDIVEVFADNEKVDNYDFIWLNCSWGSRQIADAVCVYLNYKKIPYTKVEGEKSKLVDNVRLAVNKISIPNTFYCKTRKFIKNIHHIERVCNYPVIIKTTRGSLGNGIYLAENRKELIGIARDKLKDRNHYICQEFIPNDYDYRIIVSGQQKILSAEKRTRKTGEFRNNAYLGATEEFIEKSKIDSLLLETSIGAAKALKLNWAGIDIVQSTFDGKYYVLELNRRPGLTLESSEVIAAYDHILSLLSERGLYLVA